MKAVEALMLISGRVSQEILLRNEYLAAENEILRSRLGGSHLYVAYRSFKRMMT